MKLAGQTVAVILTEERKQLLGSASFNVSESSAHIVTIEEADDLGPWIRIAREDRIHFLLLRWEFVLSMDITRETGQLIGLRG
jgi:hypothetical protein